MLCSDKVPLYIKVYIALVKLHAVHAISYHLRAYAVRFPAPAVRNMCVLCVLG